MIVLCTYGKEIKIIMKLSEIKNMILSLYGMVIKNIWNHMLGIYWTNALL